MTKHTATGARLRPILFSTAMVQAILEGRKTQTRRVVKPQHEPIEIGQNDYLMGATCPHGEPGTVLWVRETWALPSDTDGADMGYQYKADYSDGSEDWKWNPSIHMPFAAARIFLRIKSVRVERLQDINWDSAKAEGIQRFWMYGGVSVTGIPGLIYPKPNQTWTYAEAFIKLWQSINGYESWDANPWVWVVEFERISREEAGV